MGKHMCGYLIGLNANHQENKAILLVTMLSSSALSKITCAIQTNTLIMIRFLTTGGKRSGRVNRKLLMGQK